MSDGGGTWRRFRPATPRIDDPGASAPRTSASVEERIDRLEKTVGVAVDLLHRLLHPESVSKPGTPGEALMGEILRPDGSDRVRRRRAAQLHEDGAAGARVRDARRNLPRRRAGPHRPALRRCDERAPVRRPRAAAPRPQSRGRLGHARGADRRGHAPLRAGARRAAAELRHRRRRRQLDARLQPGREQEAHAGRSRRSGPAQLRPRHARRDQPRCSPTRSPICSTRPSAAPRTISRAKASTPRASASSAT